jgi:uncharacterized protein YhhL (DUF1145 family)
VSYAVTYIATGSGKAAQGAGLPAGLFITLSNALAFFIHKSKIRATTAKIQITRLLVKLERLEIILFNAFAFFIHKSKIRVLNKMISRHSSFTKRRVI